MLGERFTKVSKNLLRAVLLPVLAVENIKDRVIVVLAQRGCKISVCSAAALTAVSENGNKNVVLPYHAAN
jgi:hypothetical protein